MFPYRLSTYIVIYIIYIYVYIYIYIYSIIHSILEKADEPRSYILKTENGRTYWRNRSHIFKTEVDEVDEDHVIKISDDDDEEETSEENVIVQSDDRLKDAKRV